MLSWLKKMMKKNWVKFIGLFAILTIQLFITLHLAFPLQVSLDYSQIVTDKEGIILHSFLTKDDKWRMYTEIDEISDDLKKAILHKEDQYFYYHFGINPLAISRAAWNNIVKGKRTSGASTITMQVARLLEPKRRTYSNKFVEMFRALQLELMFSKEEILQMYLNLVPYGGNIEGVKSASVLYFKKSPEMLSLAEITALSIIPNRPNSLKIGFNNIEIEEQRNIWLKRFLEDNVFDQERIEDAIDEELTAKRQDAPHLAPHISNRLRFMYPDEPIIRSNILLAEQTKVELMMKDYLPSLQANRISNAAIIVVDNKNSEVVAYLGSADFNNTEDAGQVDGIRAIRQPGSTLKPLIYAESFDMGIYTPMSVVTDVPVNYSGYSPENYDKEYRGYVSITEALSQSLNIPAVKALHAVGLQTTIDQLVQMDFKTIEKQKEILGLSVALGGCGVTLEELTGMYHAFAKDGMYQPFSYVNEEPRNDSVRICSKETSYMISEILSQLERPDLPNQWQNASNLPVIAWKTGTSYGRRDAWSVGYNNDYTIGVWVGNFSGRGVPELSGATKATPLLFKVFNAIDKTKSKSWLTAPKSLKFRLVCSDSGLPPAEHCDNRIFDYYIPLLSSTATCTHLEKVWVAANDSFSYCNHCLPEDNYKEKMIANHPNEMLAFYKYYGIGHDIVPPHNPNCEHLTAKGRAPKIVHPVDGGVYYVNRNEIEEIVFQSYASSNVASLFWYVDDVFIQEGTSDERILWWPEEGYHKISCTDNNGMNTDIEIEIKMINF